MADQNERHELLHDLDSTATPGGLLGRGLPNAMIHDLDVAEIGSADLVAQHFVDLENSGWRALEALQIYKKLRAFGITPRGGL